MAESDPLPAETIPLPRWRPRWRIVLVGLLLLAVLLLALLWVERRTIATGFIDRELRRRDVAATYKVTGIGARTQRLEDVVIGDPARPDLTADVVEVEIALGFAGPQVRLIRGRGVRLRGRLEDGRLRLGEIDKLLPPPSGAPFQLPDVSIDLEDASMRLDTPVGVVGLALAGHGNLADGFEGRLAAAAPAMRFGDCRIDRGAALVAIGVDERRPSIEGPVRAASLSCPGVALTRPQAVVDATLGVALDSWRGDARLTLPRMQAAGAAATQLAGTISFDGGQQLTRGRIDANAATLASGDIRGGVTRIEGRYALSPASGAFSFRGDVDARGVALDRASVATVASALEGAAGTPLAPIADALAEAVRLAAQSIDVRAGLAVVTEAGGAVRIETLRADSRSGARLELGAGSGLTYYARPGLAALDGALVLSGGGFPRTEVDLDQSRAGGPIEGVARVAPMTVDGARLTLAPVRFAAGDGGRTRIDTIAVLSGPLADGQVRNLLVPVSGWVGRGGFAFGERCTTVRFDALMAAGLRLGPTRLPLCPNGGALVRSAGGRITGGATIASPRLAGTLGGSPIAVTADRLAFDVGAASFTAADAVVRLGREGSVHRLDIDRLTGDLVRGGVAGRFAGAGGKLANVPLLLSDASGSWRVIGGRASLEGSVRVADEIDPARFYPLVSKDFRLTLVDNEIDAGGWLTDPETGTQVAQVTIDHSLGTGSGAARLEVPGIAFGPAYQPEQLTRLTLGVIALVNGTVQGRGDISWSPTGVTSTGTFSTADMDLAAPFGPVEGLATSIRFTDLLGLVSAPGQVATVDVVRTGIDAFDGRISYQLLPDLKVRIEGGRWPNWGGELILEETVLDFAQPSDKRLTFRVVGLDAARFIADMEFENIAATGLLDGIVPMVFDQSGGRIVGGHLEARPEGGTLSYIGELTDKDLGAYGKLAFDALKSLSYERFVMDLDGSLDGEFVTTIELDGIARDVAAAPPAGGGIQAIFARRALSQLAKIPFEFNITVRGPFRALLATARSLEDPTLLIQSALPDELKDRPDLFTPVQPQESEPVQ